MSKYVVDSKGLFQVLAKMDDKQRSAYIIEATVKMMNGDLDVDWADKHFVKRDGERRTKPVGGYTDEFNTFWQAYPKKVGKGAAMALFKKLGQPLDECLAALKWQTKTRQWKEGYIPNPETYLRQRRFDDEPEIQEKKKGYIDMNGQWHE